jgi:sugar phosphate isomerase/epimerase
MRQPTRRDFLALSAAATLGTALSRGPAPAADPAPVIPFRLGIVTYNVAAAWDLPTLLKVLSKTGISPVEFRTTHKHGVEVKLSKEERKDVAKRCKDAGVEIWGCGTTCEFHSPDPNVVMKQIETCKQFVELAADIGGKGVKVRPNGLPANVPVEKTLAQIGQSLIPCGRAAADAGIEIWVEVHGPGTAHPPHIKTIMEQCGHKAVGVTWNSNKDDIKDGSVAEYFKLLRPWIYSCHINDLASTYPYRELFRLFRETNYNRVTLCEHGRTFPDPDQGADFLATYKRLWTELAKP